MVRVSEQVMDDWLHHQQPDALLVYVLCIHFLCISVGDSGGMQGPSEMPENEFLE